MTEWAADKVERWPISRLIPYARNARTHSEAQVAQIAGSIREWGWTMPVLADESGILLFEQLLRLKPLPLVPKGTGNG
jgi:hypothetical protein